MAGIPGKGGVKGRSGPPGNMNAFKHGLASIEKRREDVPTQHEENVRQQILEGLIGNKGGDDQISTATRILAEVIASDASLMTLAFGGIMTQSSIQSPVTIQELLISSLAQTDALAKLLIEKGLITREEFMQKMPRSGRRIKNS
jgi:hypothetical protein